MLSLDRCRQILGDECDLTDEELDKVRRALYGLADIAMSVFRQEQAIEGRRSKGRRGQGRVN
jgi:hypothetical protein